MLSSLDNKHIFFLPKTLIPEFSTINDARESPAKKNRVGLVGNNETFAAAWKEVRHLCLLTFTVQRDVRRGKPSQGGTILSLQWCSSLPLVIRAKPKEPPGFPEINCWTESLKSLFTTSGSSKPNSVTYQPATCYVAVRNWQEVK